MIKKIKYVDLSSQWNSERKKLLKIIDKSLANDNWVGGQEITKFEENIKKITKSKYAIALNSGTIKDASGTASDAALVISS